MNKLYVLVDYNLNQILTPVQYLPENWANISGLNLMNDEKIKDLNWAGHSNMGWINIEDEDISGYGCNEMWLTTSKLNLKLLVSKYRWEMENEILTVDGKNIKMDDRTKSSLAFKLSNSTEGENIVWKFLNGTFVTTYDEFVQLCNVANSYIQSCFDVEYNFSLSLDSVETVEDLVNLDKTLNWPSTTLL
jgi:hypothetical protein